MKQLILISILLSCLLFVGACDNDSDPVRLPGHVAFSFSHSDNNSSAGRVQKEDPAFVSYTIKKPDGSTISNKLALTEFNGSFVTQPEQLSPGHYTLEQFFILNSSEQSIYASPVAGSELADLVEHPLPLSFDVTSDETTSVVPEVLALADHTPEEFGYAVFGFQLVKKFDFFVTATIAADDAPSIVDYALEVVAKDAPLGNVQWTKTISMSASGNIHIPAQYNHYTFKALKSGYIPHEQHFLRSDLMETNDLSFEFIPETLEGFILQVRGGGIVKFYFPDSGHRCKVYARMDVAEGYFAGFMQVDKSAQTEHGLPLKDGLYVECDPEAPRPSPCAKNVNVFDNVPFKTATDYCSGIDLSRPHQPITMDDVLIMSYLALNLTRVVDNHREFINASQAWPGANIEW